MKLPILLIFTAGLIVTPSLRATSTTITFTTPINSLIGVLPVSASATFTITPTAGSTAGTVQITLKDTQASPMDISQLVSDLEFTLGLTGSSTFTSSSNEITISRPMGVVTSSSDVPISPTGWVLGTFNGGQIVCTVCPSGTGGAGPTQEIIGAGPYTSVDGTITNGGANTNNPYLDQTATFTITNSSITSTTKPTNVVFSFGKQFGAVGSDIGAAPEPGTLVLFGSGLLAVAGIIRRRRFKFGRA
jgi:PEP-CTERM motif